MQWTPYRKLYNRLSVAFGGISCEISRLNLKLAKTLRRLMADWILRKISTRFLFKKQKKDKLFDCHSSLCHPPAVF